MDMNSVVQPLLTDLYQVTMAYGYWRAGKHEEKAVFELFFRKNPFHGEFTIFCGLSDVVAFLSNFKVSDSDIEYLKSVLPKTTEDSFFEYLKKLDTNTIKLYAQKEGGVVFPKVPIISVEGPLLLCQLIETTILTLVNFASLVATNAVRYRLAAGPDKVLLEFGLRRAQGPDGAMTASKYCYVGGFNATSNVLAGKKWGIPVRGTQAHAFVNSFSSTDELLEPSKVIKTADGKQSFKLLEAVEKNLTLIEKVLPKYQVHQGELASFISYASAFPAGFLVLVDTYDTLSVGVTDFCAVAMALAQAGYSPLGVRIDSGDLAYQSVELAKQFALLADAMKMPWFNNLSIVASNDINEETLHSLKEQNHNITSFGIGTNLVTCQSQPALGCVYKIVQLGDRACIKLSQEIKKITVPGKKKVYRLYGKDGNAILDVITRDSDAAPEPGKKFLCRDPFVEQKRAFVEPTKVESLLLLVWGAGVENPQLPTLEEVRQNVQSSLASLRADTKRRLNPTPYKVSLSESLHKFLHQLWLENAAIGELS